MDSMGRKGVSSAVVVFLILIVIVAVMSVVAILLLQGQETGPVACTADAKICPDGTAVGRVGPNCEFAPCPEPIGCPEDAKVCPDGSTVSRVPPTCEFAPCPEAPTCEEDTDCMVNPEAHTSCCIVGTDVCSPIILYERLPPGWKCDPDECVCVSGMCEHRLNCYPPDEYECTTDSDCYYDEQKGRCCIIGTDVCSNTSPPFAPCPSGYTPTFNCSCEAGSCKLLGDCLPQSSVGPLNIADQSRCAGITDIYKEGSCLTDLAKEEKNSDYCQFINDPHWENSCYLGVGKLTLDPGDCFATYYTGGDCYNHVRERNENPSLCLTITGRDQDLINDIKDDCIYRASMKANTADYCGNILDVELRDQCFTNIATNQSNLTMCLLTSNSTQVSVCMKSVITWNSLNAGNCTVFDHVNYHYTCKALATGDVSHCYEVMSVSMREWCLANA
ncbi:MAG: hypothetical protein JXB14_00230 [Candidatus Altiarchaeota archaeon]|nr:hypothetical protein [Candidatus Altiarchaeota archaeon]